MRIKLAIAGLLLMTGGLIRATERPKSVIHVSHLGPMAVGISCLNGADPTGKKFDEVLIISCGKE